MTHILDILKTAGRAADAYDRTDGRFSRRSDWIALASVSLGLILRLWTAAVSPLNADEAWRCLTANAGGLREILNAAEIASQSPLLILFLRVMKALGNGDIWLRLIPVLAGGATPFIVYLWLKLRFGRPAALFAGLLLAFSPTLITLSAEIRPYTLALFFAACALYALECSIAGKSVRWVVGFNLCLLLSLASDISAVFFAVAAACYFLVRLFEPAITASMRVAWMLGQAGAVSLYVSIHSTRLTQLMGLRHDPGYYAAWLDDALPRLGDSPYRFVAGGTLKQFLFVIPSLPTAVFGMAVFGLTALVLFRRETRRSVSTALLLLTPFAAAALSAFAHLHPYGMLRETSLLALFVASGIGIGLGAPMCGRVLPAIFLAFLFTPLWHVQVLRDPSLANRKAALARSIESVKSSIPAGGLALADAKSRLLLGHYLAPELWTPNIADLPHEDHIAGMTLFVVTWSYAGDRKISEDLALLRKTYPALTGPVPVIRETREGLSVSPHPLPERQQD